MAEGAMRSSTEAIPRRNSFSVSSTRRLAAASGDSVLLKKDMILGFHLHFLETAFMQHRGRIKVIGLIEEFNEFLSVQHQGPQADGPELSHDVIHPFLQLNLGAEKFRFGRGD